MTEIVVTVPVLPPRKVPSPAVIINNNIKPIDDAGDLFVYREDRAIITTRSMRSRNVIKSLEQQQQQQAIQ